MRRAWRWRSSRSTRRNKCCDRRSFYPGRQSPNERAAPSPSWPGSCRVSFVKQVFGRFGSPNLRHYAEPGFDAEGRGGRGARESPSPAVDVTAAKTAEGRGLVKAVAAGGGG